MGITGLGNRAVNAAVDDEPRYLVTLASAAAPQELRRPRDAVFADYSLFITSELMQGRERYCLQMGYFHSMAEAAAMAGALRSRYPGAVAVMASDDNQRRRALVQQMLTDTQTLRLLEQGSAGNVPGSECVRVITPDDPLALQELEAEVQAGVPACFAVQLAWSVHPIDSARIGYLPVFSTGVLYPLRGVRQGRAWYAYRLGFYETIEAAQQVAGGLRDDYASVVIVPVSSAERQRTRVQREPLPPVAAPEAVAPSADVWRRNEPRSNPRKGSDLNDALQESVRPRLPVAPAKGSGKGSGFARWLGFRGSPRRPV